MTIKEFLSGLSSTDTPIKVLDAINGKTLAHNAASTLLKEDVSSIIINQDIIHWDYDFYHWNNDINRTEISILIWI